MSIEALDKVKSKVLLFGEYSLIYDSMALSIPFEKFGGKLTFNPNKLDGKASEKSNKHLLKYAKYLHKNRNNFPFEIDTYRMLSDIDKGLVFDSNIPQGFGVGSSGALVADIFSEYVSVSKTYKSEDQLPKEKLATLKEYLGLLESYFHGSSSGVDPLICFLQKPLLIKSKSDINTFEIPEDLHEENKKGAIFLLDTGRPGMTAGLVNHFIEKCKEEDYFDLVKSHFIPFTNDCVNHFLNGEFKDLFKKVKYVSKFVLSHLSPMVPDDFKDVIKKGLDTGKYTLKLCGSGGGGYLLGFTEDLEETKKELKDYRIELIKKV